MKKDDEKHIRNIQRLAARLPWIVVGVVLITAVITILQIYFGLR